MEKSSQKVFFIFPVHIFRDVTILKNYDHIFIIEDPIYFTKYNFHKLKLMYHRATMKSYFDYLSKHKELSITYVEYHASKSEILDSLKKDDKPIKALGFYDPVDKELTRELQALCTKYKLKSEIHNNLQFLCTVEDLNSYLYSDGTDTHKKYTHDNSFYRWQRRRLNILMGKDGKDPAQWSYDSENRQPFKGKGKIPAVPKPIKSPYVDEAREYVNVHFKKNVGKDAQFVYPFTFEDADKWLDNFLEVKLSTFGPYQDAVNQDHPFMFHSILSPMMNVGILPAKQIVDTTLKYYKEKKNVPIQSVEGFIRQIIGWREYVRMLYVFESENQRSKNFMQHSTKLNKNWYAPGSLSIPAIDDMIKKLDKYAYLHHIERLMYVGNFMLLCRIDPTEVFKWFMEYFIDSYDWVMVPNIFGMTQFADGGLMMTRPYFSSSNYVIKMSSYKKGDRTVFIGKKEYDWSEIWDALYYYFISDNEEMLKKFYATARNVGHWERKSKEDRKSIKETAEKYLKEFIC